MLSERVCQISEEACQSMCRLWLQSYTYLTLGYLILTFYLNVAYVYKAHYQTIASHIVAHSEAA